LGGVTTWILSSSVGRFNGLVNNVPYGLIAAIAAGVPHTVLGFAAG
jgi:hypothetical protein